MAVTKTAIIRSLKCKNYPIAHPESSLSLHNTPRLAPDLVLTSRSPQASAFEQPHLAEPSL